MKHIVCYSGGHSSALVAVEVVRKFGAENVILLNHNISSFTEDEDVKRFKTQVSEQIGVPITYANVNGITEVKDLPDQFDVVMKAQAFKVGRGTELCTSRLKTEPFMKFLEENFPEKDCLIYYGFDANEQVRIQRRSSILGGLGYRTDYPLAIWPIESRTIFSTKEIGIEPPQQYTSFKHGNCKGCLKAGKQHWYIIFCERKDIYEKAKKSEDLIGYTIMKDYSLEELEPVFSEMQAKSIPRTEHIKHQTFWASVRKAGIDTTPDKTSTPCECSSSSPEPE